MHKLFLQLQELILSNKIYYIFLGIILFIIIFASFTYLQILRDERYEHQAFSRIYRKDKKKNLLTDVILVDLKQNIDALVAERGKPKESGYKLFNILISLIFSIIVFMLLVKQPVFAIVLPIILLYVMTKITGLIKKSFGDYVLVQLPSAIENIIRVFSGYNDLKTVLYEAGENLPQPMRGILQDLSRRMQTEPATVVLNDFMDTSKNIWIYCLTFNLLSYVEDANKEDVIDNLRELKDIVDRDNREKKKQKLERKLTTSINYVLCALAFAGFIGNLIFNRNVSIPFFFSSIGGILCFLVGMTLLVISIFSNILIGNEKD